MIIFDQLRISDDGKRMYINAHVNKADYFDNVYIESVTIMTSDRVSETAPEAPASDYIYKKEIEGKQKEINFVLTANDFLKSWETDPKSMFFNVSDMSRTLFFVYITCKVEGTLDPCTPCRLDEKTTLGVVFDENILYQRVMDYTKELVADCTEHIDFIDFILQWNAFKASIETEHYISAIKFFNLLFSNEAGLNYNKAIKGCGCHG